MASTEDVVSVLQAFEGDAGFLSTIDARFEDEMRLNGGAARQDRRPGAARRFRRRTVASTSFPAATAGSLLLRLVLLSCDRATVGGVGHPLAEDEQRGVFHVISLLGLFAFARALLPRRPGLLLLLLWFLASFRLISVPHFVVIVIVVVVVFVVGCLRI